MADKPNGQVPERASEGFTQLRFNHYRYVKDTRSLISPDGNETRLRAKTCLVFEQLAKSPNKVVTREALVNAVWEDVIVTEDTLNQSIREIRKALGDTDRTTLETLSRQGYMLHTVQIPPEVLSAAATKKTSHKRFAVIAGAIALLIGGAFVFSPSPDTSESAALSASKSEPQDAAKVSANAGHTLKVLVTANSESDPIDSLVRMVVTELSRYSNIEPTQRADIDANYRLELSAISDDANSVNVQLFHLKTNELVVAENFLSTESSKPINLAGRISGLIGSPAGGAIGHHLLKVSRAKPVDELTRVECLAHGYDCTSCSGEFDSITPRAVQCLSNLLEQNATDADAWALQSTVFSRQYMWGSSLQEPLRSDKSKREHLRAKAIEAATRADAEANGNNPSVYWGMVQANIGTCNADKVQTAVDRGLKLTPDDPTLMAVYGNFLSYVGKWDEGKKLVDKALEREPRFFKKWWYMAPAKWHYRRGEYEKAYDVFLKSYDERNWLSHLQMAYTLPHLGRIEEGKQALKDFMRVAPSMTREHVYELYRSYCFDDEYLNQIKEAFDLIDMPSRGSGDDFKNIKPVRATVEKIGDRMVEYVDVGEGVPIIFVHGSISDYRTWGYMALPISKKHRFLSYTLRHFGTFDWSVDEPVFDKNRDATDLIEFIEHKGFSSVHLVGWSRSGSILGDVAKQRPDLVKSFIVYEPVISELIDPKSNPNTPPGDSLPDFEKTFSYFEMEQYESAVQEFFEQVLQYNTGEFKTQPTILQQVVLDNARTLPLTLKQPPPNQPIVDCEFLKNLTTPGLILYGENTNAPWQYMSTRYAECLVNGKAIAVKNATHDGPLSQPQQVADLIDAFVTSH